MEVWRLKVGDWDGESGEGGIFLFVVVVVVVWVGRIGNSCR